MLAHFPSALFPTSFLFDVIGWMYHEPVLFRSSFYCQLTGIVIGAFTITIGLVDLYGIFKSGQDKSVNTTMLHGGLNAGVFIMYFGILVYRLKHPIQMELWLLVIEGFALVFLMIGNFFGGEVYQQVVKDRFQR